SMTDSLFAIFAINKLRDLKKHCREATVSKRDLTDFIMWRRSSADAAVPALVRPSPVRSRALNPVGFQRSQRTVSVDPRRRLKRLPTKFSPPSKNAGCHFFLL